MVFNSVSENYCELEAMLYTLKGKEGGGDVLMGKYYKSQYFKKVVYYEMIQFNVTALHRNYKYVTTRNNLKFK